MMMVQWHCAWFVLILANVANCLKIISFYMPRGASHEAPIDCRYDVEGETLYDVKWYKDERQFFRCLADGTVQEFPLEGVSIYHSPYAAVGSCPLTLTKLSSSSTGKYTCEVSLDAPTFRTVSDHRIFRFVQSSPRTQELDEANAEQIQSKSHSSTSANVLIGVSGAAQNQTDVLRNGTHNLSSWHLSLVILMLIICRY